MWLKLETLRCTTNEEFRLAEKLEAFYSTPEKKKKNIFFFLYEGGGERQDKWGFTNLRFIKNPMDFECGFPIGL